MLNLLNVDASSFYIVIVIEKSTFFYFTIIHEYVLFVIYWYFNSMGICPLSFLFYP